MAESVTPGCALRSQYTYQSGARPWRQRLRGLDRGRQVRRPGLWNPAFFRRQARLVLKGGMIAAALMGDRNASIRPRSQCAIDRFGALGKAPGASCWPSSGCIAGRTPPAREPRSDCAPRATRGRLANATGAQRSTGPPSIDPERYTVTIDGQRSFPPGPRCCRWRSANFLSEPADRPHYRRDSADGARSPPVRRGSAP